MKRAATPDPLKLGALCSLCPFAKGKKAERPVFGVGPEFPVGVLVGESPGRDEAERGAPFVGATGQQLDDELEAVKLQRAKLFIVNAICCLPPIGKTEGQMRKAADCCRRVLLRQLEVGNRQHVPVLAMGRWACYGLTGKERGVMNARGFLRDWDIKSGKEADAHFRAKHVKRPSRRAEARRRRSLRIE